MIPEPKSRSRGSTLKVGTYSLHSPRASLSLPGVQSPSEPGRVRFGAPSAAPPASVNNTPTNLDLQQWWVGGPGKSIASGPPMSLC